MFKLFKYTIIVIDIVSIICLIYEFFFRDAGQYIFQFVDIVLIVFMLITIQSLMKLEKMT